MATHETAHAHPGARKYIQIAVILTAITALEVAVYYLSGLRSILGGILIVLSALKFALVVMFYMHLKFDDRLFTGLFVGGLSAAAFTIIMFIALFHGLIQM
ncbi:MAG: hypothetical protein HW416_2470 [Chloroflexi bacterium]|nr:hypothetical protein [Chloroflexota bacterium]